MADFDFHVHGLWIIGALFFFVAGIMAGNLQWELGTTEVSFGISALLIFLLFLIAALFWISAAVNARHDELGTREQRFSGHQCCCDKESNVRIKVHRDGHVEHFVEERASRA